MTARQMGQDPGQPQVAVLAKRALGAQNRELKVMFPTQVECSAGKRGPRLKKQGGSSVILRQLSGSTSTYLGHALALRNTCL